jgi:hypothetical protein
LESKPQKRGSHIRIALLTLLLGQIRDRGDLGASIEQVPTISDLL